MHSDENNFTGGGFAGDSRSMYELEYPAPVVSSPTGEEQGPPLIVALHGYADAGQAVEASADHLKAALDNRLVASFNTDELVNYRSRRPATTIGQDRPVEIEDLNLDIRVLRDSADKPFLLLSGPEPDLRWNAFTKAITDLATKFKVSKTLVVYSAPAPAPHTRPLVISAHGNTPELMHGMFQFDSTMIVPGAAPLYIEKALEQAGGKVAGYTAHVPHYLSASAYPEATLSLLSTLSSAAELSLPLKSLEGDMERFQQQLEEQIADSEEVAAVVAQLEDQYDDYLDSYRKDHPQELSAGDAAMPSAEELSQEFEAFLSAVENEDSWRDQILHDDLNDREENVAGMENTSEKAASEEIEKDNEAEGSSEPEDPEI